MSSSKVYTRTGDKGQTSLIGGQRVSKSDLRLEAYGTLDELNSCLGVMIEAMKSGKTAHEPSLVPVFSFLNGVQNHLFDIGSQLACEDAKIRESLPTVTDADVSAFESEMDSYSADLPQLKNFVLPGGSRAAAAAHVARTVCRRAERLCVGLSETEGSDVNLLLIRYVNRLSDYLFVLARFLNRLEGIAEPLWAPRK